MYLAAVFDTEFRIGFSRQGHECAHLASMNPVRLHVDKKKDHLFPSRIPVATSCARINNAVKVREHVTMHCLILSADTHPVAKFNRAIRIKKKTRKAL